MQPETTPRKIINGWNFGKRRALNCRHAPSGPSSSPSNAHVAKRSAESRARKVGPCGGSLTALGCSVRAAAGPWGTAASAPSITPASTGASPGPSASASPIAAGLLFGSRLAGVENALHSNLAFSACADTSRSASTRSASTTMLLLVSLKAALHPSQGVTLQGEARSGNFKVQRERGWDLTRAPCRTRGASPLVLAAPPSSLMARWQCAATVRDFFAGATRTPAHPGKGG